MRLNADECQLVLVDYQEKLMPAMHGADDVLHNARRLAQVAAWMEVPVWGTEQRPDKLGQNHPDLRQHCRETLAKHHFSAVPSGLAQRLASMPARPQIVIAGCEAHICLMQTGLDLLAAGWSLWVVSDACASRLLQHRDAGLARLAASGACLVPMEMLIFEWLGHSEHPFFRDVQRLIK